MPATASPARATPWEWLRTGLLGANLAWTCLNLGGFLPGARIAMAVLTTALLAAHLLDPERGGRAHPAGWLFAPFLAYAAANIAWVSPVKWLGWIDWLTWAQAAAVFWVALNGINSRSCRAALVATLAALGITAGAMAAYQHFRDPAWLMLGRHQAAQFLGRATGFFGIPNSLGVFMGLLIPPALALTFGRGRSANLRIAAGFTSLLLLLGFVLAVSRGAWLALAAALVLRPPGVAGRGLGVRLLAAAATLAAAAAAAAAITLAFPLMAERVHQLVQDLGEKTRPILWRGAWRLFRAHPVWGAGGASFDPLFEAYRPQGYIDQPYYAHCDYLQMLSDYGATGFVLFFGAVAVLAIRTARAPGLAGAAYTGLLAFFLHLLVDFHLHIPALALTVATIAALLTASAWPTPAPAARPGITRRLAAGGVLAAAAAALVLLALPTYRAEEVRRAAREQIDRMARDGSDVSKDGARLDRIRAELVRATALDPRNGQAWSDRAYADSLAALVTPRRTEVLGGEVEREARKAIDLSAVVPEFWVRLGTGYDMERRWAQGGTEYVEALRLAPKRADLWYYEAYHLSLNPRETGAALGALGIALRLDPGNALAQSLRQRLETR